MWLGKRVFDILFATAGLIVLSPLLLVIAVWIKLDSKGPVFFRQRRVGQHQKDFYIHKFRTMYTDAEKRGLKITVGEDPRITKAGYFLRKFKIDEFPQLIDVFIGTMSVVGPRPEVPQYVAMYPEEKRNKIFKMRPGITDWASVKFKDENEILGQSNEPEKTYIEKILPIKISYYEEYADNSSFFEDLKIIFTTIKEVFVRN